MTLQEYVDYIKFSLTGGVLELEIPDESIALAVNQCLQEIQRYTNEFRLVEKEFSSCIDISDLDSYAVVHVYRTKSIASYESSEGPTDPMYLQYWASFGAGTTYNLNQYLLNLASYSTLQQIRNTLSTDLYFKEDVERKKLYINISMGSPTRVLIEYIPIYKDVSEVRDAFWMDYLKRLALARIKIVLGRLRTAVKHAGSLIGLDGEIILAEGNQELASLREELEKNTDIFYPLD